jgi:8-oxo-dGTP pyrophosphatase MutT (NUDIX family)
MFLELFEDNLSKEDCKHLTPRVGVRAILKHNDDFILVYNKNWDLYTLPGGGVHKNETLIDALKREVFEETGYKVQNIKEGLTLTEYFYDSIWEHHFYYCETVGQNAPLTLTDEEIASGLEVVVKSYIDVLDIFVNHESPRENAENIYQREFLGFMHSLEVK